MKDSILRNNITTWLDRQGRNHVTFPQVFTAQEVASAVEGSAVRIGHVADAVVAELKGRGHSIKYEKLTSGCRFTFAKANARKRT